MNGVQPETGIAAAPVEDPRENAARAFSRLSPNVRGALWMLASAAGFTAMTTLVKYLGGDYPPAVQTFYRQAAGLVILIPVIVRMRGAAFATTRPGVLIFRSVAGTIAMTLSFYAFQKMPLADASALSFTRSLWMAPLAVIMLRERVGAARAFATTVGFIGVLLMIRPGGHGGLAAGAPALAMLAASLLMAFMITGMKVLTRDHSPMVLLVWYASLGFLLALPGALMISHWPTPGDFALLCLMGVLATLTQGCYVKGIQAGDAMVMAPMDYMRLIFAAVVDLAVFHNPPSIWTIGGASIVIATTVFITWREHLSATRGDPLLAE